jgi:hypothetical protein
MPSGHSTSAALIWPLIAHWARKRWAWVVAVLLAFLIGFSRIYLGAHFPLQVLAGWALGALLFAIYLGVHLSLVAWLGSLGLPEQLLLAIVLPIILVLIHPVPDVIASMAVLLGLGVGLTLMYRYVDFSPAGSWGHRIGRYIIGVVVIFALYLGLSAVFPGEGEPLYLPLRFVRYSLIGLWMTLGAPWTFRKLRLA